MAVPCRPRVPGELLTAATRTHCSVPRSGVRVTPGNESPQFASVMQSGLPRLCMSFSVMNGLVPLALPPLAIRTFYYNLCLAACVVELSSPRRVARDGDVVRRPPRGGWLRGLAESQTTLSSLDLRAQYQYYTTYTRHTHAGTRSMAANIPSADGIDVGASSLSSTAAADWLPLVANFVAQNNADPKALWTSFSMIIVSSSGCREGQATE